jgi:hypothetical protein
MRRWAGLLSISKGQLDKGERNEHTCRHEGHGRRGLPGVVVSPGESTKVVSLSSGEMRKWPISSYTVDANQDISSVFVVNQKALKVSTIMWGVLLGNLLTRIVGAVAYAITRCRQLHTSLYAVERITK